MFIHQAQHNLDAHSQQMAQRKVERSARCGFTLVELLVGISIIGILAGMVLLAIRGAQHDSNVSSTRATIAKIHAAFVQKFDDYLTHPMPLQIPEAAFAINPVNGQRTLSARDMASVRLMAMRDLMRLEMPDRPGDIKFSRNPASNITNYFENQVPVIIQLVGTRMPAPAALRSIRRTVESVPPLPASATPPFYWENQNANAELLYLVVSQISINGESAIDDFRPTEIGDTDKDGLKEFLDSWGQPIQWIRWPAGYAASHPGWNGVPFGLDESDQTDPLDPLRADIAWNPLGSGLGPGAGLFPLIFSVGLDGLSGMVTNSENATGDWSNAYFSASDVQSGGAAYPDPYHPRGLDYTVKLGYVVNQKLADDNVTNFDDYGGSL